MRDTLFFLLLDNLGDLDCGPVGGLVTLRCLLDNIFMGFGSKLCGQVVGIPVGAGCAPLVADLFLFCYERYFMLSLSDNNQCC